MTTAILVVVGLLVLAVVAVVAIGARLPRNHTATRSAHLRQSPEAIWAALTDVEAYPRWRPGMKRVERLSDEDGRPRWREHDRNGKITYEVLESTAPARLVVRIADENLPFGGRWTYTIAAASDGGSVLTVTEDGEVKNPVFRFVSRYVMGHTATMDRYLKALGAR